MLMKGKVIINLLILKCIFISMLYAGNATYYDTLGRKNADRVTYNLVVDVDGNLVNGSSTYKKTLGASGNEFSNIYLDSLTVNGVTVSSLGSVVSPFEDSGTTITATGSPTKFIFTHSTGDLECTRITSDDYYGATNSQNIDLDTNNSFIFSDNSDNVTINFDGDDALISTNDGSIELLPEASAADGTIDMFAGGDTNDYCQFILNATNEPSLNFSGCDGIITADGGDIDFKDENLATTGTASFGATTVTSIAGVDTITGSTHSDVLSFAADDILSFTSNDSSSTISVIGVAANDAYLILSADASGDNGDDWQLESDQATNSFILSNDTSGSQVAKLTISTAGRMTLGGDRITLDEGEYISNATDDTITLSSNDSVLTVDVLTPATSNGSANLSLSANNGTDPGDRWLVQASGVTEDFYLYNDTNVADTFVARLKIAGSDGDIGTYGDVEIVDDMDLVLGSDADWKVQYDEGVDDQLIFITANTGATATTDPMVEFLVGATPTADQQVFGVAKGTQASNTALFTVDEDGDVVSTGDITSTLDMIVTGQDITLGATGVKLTGDNDGAITLLGLSAGYDEDMTINLDDTEDEWTFSSSTGVTLMNLSGALDLQVSGGDLTLPSATASKPVLWLENTADDATCPSIILENDRATEADGDDCGIIYFRASDGGDATFDAVTILGEATDITATQEAGSLTIDVEINDTATEMLKMYGDAGDVTTGHIYFNADEADVDFHVSGDTTADYLVIDAGAETTTFQSGVTLMPTISLVNTNTDANSAILNFKKDGEDEADGDDLGLINFYGNDSANNDQVFGYIKAESNEIDTTDEAGKISINLEVNDSDTQFLQMFGDTTGADTAHVEFNSGSVDIDFHIDSADQADLFMTDAGSNDVMVTRDLAAANTDAALLQILNDNVGDDQSAVSIIHDADATASNPAVSIQSTSTAFDQSTVFINRDTTTGATGEAALKIDSEDPDSAALYITSANDASGTTQAIDDYAAAIVSEGVGGGLSVYRNVSAATESLVRIDDTHVDSTSPLAVFTTDQDASADDDQVQIIATSSAFDKTLLFIDNDCAAGSTTEPTMEIDSEQISAAALIIKSPNDTSGTSAVYDDYVVVIDAEGVGGALNLNRNVSASTGALLNLLDDHVDGTSPLAVFTTDQDASADDAAVQIITTSAAHDEAALSVTQAGTGAAINVVSGALAVNGDSITCDGTLVINATSETSFNDENISNVGDIACDTITSDAATVVKINDGLQGLVDEITATDAGVAASLTSVITEITTNGDSDLDMVTLGNGVSGQIKIFVVVVEGNAGDTVKITPTTFLEGSQITFDGTVGQGCTMVYADSEGWCVVGNNGGVIA